MDNEESRPIRAVLLFDMGELFRISGFSGRLLDGNGFGEVAGHVDVASFFDGDVVGEQLERNGRDDRRDTFGDVVDFEIVVGEVGDHGVAFGYDGDDGSSAGFDLLDV